MGSPAEELAVRVKSAVERKVGHAAVLGGKHKGGVGCFALVNEVLKSAGARTAADFGTITPDADYVWGEAVPDVKDVKPGDILQFEDHVITIRTDTVSGPTPGKVKRVITTQTATRPHHTAVVVEVLKDGGVAVVEQHVKPDIHKVFRHTLLRLTEGIETRMTSNSIIQIEVTGKVNAYRPVPKPKDAVYSPHR
jgi:hypothetical protein